MGWVRSQLALNTGTLTCGSWDGRGARGGEGVAVGAGRALAAGRDATAGCGVAGRAVAACGGVSLWGCKDPSARVPGERAQAADANRDTGGRRRGGATSP